MSTQTSKPRFKHNPVRGMPERVESFCLRCGQFVGASDNPRSLKIAEKAHLCPESKGLKGLDYLELERGHRKRHRRPMR